ncbi:hypothetical protein yrohd0001_25290 [Yersinia rohdei ATCC 43380]|nr:hypothetical protein yrohd0001_25290 [Yersinia rohdei ATCC 43380]
MFDHEKGLCGLKRQGLTVEIDMNQINWIGRYSARKQNIHKHADER